MKTLFTAILICLAAVAARATVLFSDSLNYPDGCIETDGVWYAYAPAVPKHDAMVTNDLLILYQNNSDAVAAPFTNSDNTITLFASFTINVSKLPTGNGGYFCIFKDNTNDYVSHIIIDAAGTAVPGTYRLGIANFATSIATSGATNFPMDLATGITYQVVMNYQDSLGGTLWINPSSAGDYNVYGTDTTTNTYLLTITNSQIGFSQYANQGTAAIGNVKVGTTFGDVDAAIPALAVFGIQPQGATNYSGNNLTLYGVASGIDVTYQWLSNNVPLVDNGVTVVGSTSNTLNLTNLQASANYSVVASVAGAGSVTSAVAVVSINTTPTAPFFIRQPFGATNTLGSTITLTAPASGTGPIAYQWYFEVSGGGSFSPVSGGTSATLSQANANYGESGSYYVIATNSVGGSNSVTVSVLVVPPPPVTIAYLHGFLTNNPPSSYYYPNGTAQYTVQGVVTSFGEAVSGSYSDFFIQDATAGALVYCGTPNTNVPPAGTLVSVTGEAEQYYGELEVVAYATNVSVISYNNPMPAPVLLNLPVMATNPMGTYGLNIQCSLVTLTNVWLYSSAAGGAVSGTYPANSSKTLYAFQQPYSNNPSAPYMEIYVLTKTNAVNQLNTNFWGQPVPSFAYEITGPMAIYSTTTPEIDPTRFADIVTNPPAAFNVSLTLSNGAPTLAWPAVTGQTYSVYSATSLFGPWTQTFGLGYYPSIGAYTDTNPAAAKFYRVSTP